MNAAISVSPHGPLITNEMISNIREAMLLAVHEMRWINIQSEILFYCDLVRVGEIEKLLREYFVKPELENLFSYYCTCLSELPRRDWRAIVDRKTRGGRCIKGGRIQGLVNGVDAKFNAYLNEKFAAVDEAILSAAIRSEGGGISVARAVQASCKSLEPFATLMNYLLIGGADSSSWWSPQNLFGDEAFCHAGQRIEGHLLKKRLTEKMARRFDGSEGLVNATVIRNGSAKTLAEKPTTVRVLL